ncbi:hypothetical protein SS05631_c17270 [Sinorhizobium sp. CCBAU 05631]|nr:hypothetical protein SS05631_c17270 [Sinorhizobium sp. CCBAU 05631]
MHKNLSAVEGALHDLAGLQVRDYLLSGKSDAKMPDLVSNSWCGRKHLCVSAAVPLKERAVNT